MGKGWHSAITHKSNEILKTGIMGFTKLEAPFVSVLRTFCSALIVDLHIFA